MGDDARMGFIAERADCKARPGRSSRGGVTLECDLRRFSEPQIAGTAGIISASISPFEVRREQVSASKAKRTFRGGSILAVIRATTSTLGTTVVTDL